jgi:hypothetical protein
VNAQDIEIAVADYFNPRRCLIIPNVSWGLLRYGMEVDVLVIQPSGWAAEVEIKISASDIRADKKKRRHVMAEHYPEYNELFRLKYFAVPEKLILNPDIPASCGIIAVGNYGGIFNSNCYSDAGKYAAKVIRPAKVNPRARQLTAKEVETALRLASMRVWTMKKVVQKYRHEIHLAPSPQPEETPAQIS